MEDQIICFSEVVQDTVEENDEEWHLQIQQLLEKIDMGYPLFHYIYYLYLNEIEEECNSFGKHVLLNEDSKFSSLKNTTLKLEDLVKLDGINKRKCISNFLREIDNLSDAECVSNVCNDVIDESESCIDRNVNDQLEIEEEFLKLLDASSYEHAITMLSEGALPSQSALNRLIKEAVKTLDQDLLKELRGVLPVKSEMSDGLYGEENMLWMIEINKIWNEDKRQDALYQALLRYEVLFHKK